MAGTICVGEADIAGKGKVPFLQLVVKGYLLQFVVKLSNIPDAGFGVFVQCVKNFGVSSNAKKKKNNNNGNGSSSSDYGDAEDRDQFVLGDYEMLDLGIYAPFQHDDIKTESVFKLKNFIHQLACDEWSFSSSRSNEVYDITGDVDGKPHEIARSHTLMYVNECNEGESPNIRAVHDVSGAVHYLMEVDALEVGGEPRELYIDYGEKYERIRFRKGYSKFSFDPEAEAQLKGKDKEELVDDDDSLYIEEVEADYSAIHCMDAVEFIMNNNFKNATPLVKKRIGILLNSIYLRIQKLIKQRGQSDYVVQQLGVVSVELDKLRELFPYVAPEYKLKNARGIKADSGGGDASSSSSSSASSSNSGSPSYKSPTGSEIKKNNFSPAREIPQWGGGRNAGSSSNSKSYQGQVARKEGGIRLPAGSGVSNVSSSKKKSSKVNVSLASPIHIDVDMTMEYDTDESES